jgi:hypothetical protein
LLQDRLTSLSPQYLKVESLNLRLILLSVDSPTEQHLFDSTQDDGRLDTNELRSAPGSLADKRSLVALYSKMGVDTSPLSAELGKLQLEDLIVQDGDSRAALGMGTDADFEAVARRFSDPGNLRPELITDNQLEAAKTGLISYQNKLKALISAGGEPQELAIYQGELAKLEKAERAVNNAAAQRGIDAEAAERRANQEAEQARIDAEAQERKDIHTAAQTEINQAEKDKIDAQGKGRDDAQGKLQDIGFTTGTEFSDVENMANNALKVKGRQLEKFKKDSKKLTDRGKPGLAMRHYTVLHRSVGAIRKMISKAQDPHERAALQEKRDYYHSAMQKLAPRREAEQAAMEAARNAPTASQQWMQRQKEERDREAAYEAQQRKEQGLE